MCLTLHNNPLPVLHHLTLRLSNQILRNYFMSLIRDLKNLSLSFDLFTFCCLGSGLRSRFSLLQTSLLIEPCALILDCD